MMKDGEDQLELFMWKKYYEISIRVKDGRTFYIQYKE